MCDGTGRRRSKEHRLGGEETKIALFITLDASQDVVTHTWDLAAAVQ